MTAFPQKYSRNNNMKIIGINLFTKTYVDPMRDSSPAAPATRTHKIPSDPPLRHD